MLTADLGEVERLAEHQLHLGWKLGNVVLAAPDPDDGLQLGFVLGRAHPVENMPLLAWTVKCFTRAMHAAKSAGAI